MTQAASPKGSATWLICGGRTWDRHAFTFLTLDQLAAERGFPDFVIDGKARGADSLGHEWALSRGLHGRRFPADWKTHGPAAGPIRNQRMLDEGKPTLVIAFPGGRGTADMVHRANKAGVEVVHITVDPQGKQYNQASS